MNCPVREQPELSASPNGSFMAKRSQRCYACFHRCESGPVSDRSVGLMRLVLTSELDTIGKHQARLPSSTGILRLRLWLPDAQIRAPIPGLISKGKACFAFVADALILSAYPDPDLFGTQTVDLEVLKSFVRSVCPLSDPFAGYFTSAKCLRSQAAPSSKDSPPSRRAGRPRRALSCSPDPTGGAATH